MKITQDHLLRFIAAHGFHAVPTGPNAITITFPRSWQTTVHGKTITVSDNVTETVPATLTDVRAALGY